MQENIEVFFCMAVIGLDPAGHKAEVIKGLERKRASSLSQQAKVKNDEQRSQHPEFNQAHVRWVYLATQS
jgi:hypothetical protein